MWQKMQKLQNKYYEIIWWNILHKIGKSITANNRKIYRTFKKLWAISLCLTNEGEKKKKKEPETKPPPYSRWHIKKAYYLKKEQKFYIAELGNLYKFCWGPELQISSSWKITSTHFTELLFSRTENKGRQEEIFFWIFQMKWFSNKLLILNFLFSHLFFWGEKNVPVFQNDCNWKELQVEYSTLMGKKKKKNCLSMQQTFLTEISFQFVLRLLLLLSFWDCQQYCQECCMLLRHHKMLL